MSSKLNLGCGADYREGFVNVDNNPNYKADVVHDLNRYPYPLNESSFTEIYSSHVIEHLSNPIDFLIELYRLGANDATVVITCPHFSGNWMHPLHRTAISSRLFDFVDQSNSEYYGRVRFESIEVRLRWLRPASEGKRTGRFLKTLDRIISFLGNLNLPITERIWCFWVGGFEEIEFRAKIVK